MKKYMVELTSEERKQLQQLVKKGKVPGYKIRHAQMLLQAQSEQTSDTCRSGRHRRFCLSCPRFFYPCWVNDPPYALSMVE